MTICVNVPEYQTQQFDKFLSSFQRSGTCRFGLLTAGSLETKCVGYGTRWLITSELR